MRGFAPVFSFRVDSLSLSYSLGDHKAVVLFVPHSWGSVHEHQGIFYMLVGLHIACLGAQFPCIAVGRHYIVHVEGEAMYWQRETYALFSPFQVTASQQR